MAYFDNTDNTNFYSAPFSSGEFMGYPFLNQVSVTEETNVQTLGTFADDWSVGGGQGCIASSSRGLGAGPSLESVTSVNPYEAQSHSHGEPSFPEYYWPVTGQYTQSRRSEVLSRDNSFANIVASEAPTEISAPSSAPLYYWGDNESGLSTSTFRTNVQTPHQYSTGSTSAGMMQTWRFRPYETPGARSNEYTNAEAGPSTLAPPFVPYVVTPATYPSGGLSEATADAEYNLTITEEDAAPTARQPRGTGPVRKWRVRYQEDMHKLRAWAKGWKGLKKLPTQVEALSIALEMVELIHDPIYDEPRLSRGKGQRTVEGTRPDAEYERRKGARGLNEELSRYYRLATNQGAWGCPELLSKVLSDAEGFS